jgi:cytoskeletal protein CcmA (bactofilin family)
MKKPMLQLVVIMVMLVPALAYAGPIIRTGESISIDSSQSLEGDFYGFSPAITISGAAEDDVYLLGGTVTINAPIAGDLTIVGGAIQIHGDVGDDLRILGGDVTIADEVKGDVVMLAGMLTILSTANIGGDVIFMGGELAVEGPVAGGIHGTADRIRINSKVAGDLSISAETLITLGNKANVLGDITYKSRSDIMRGQDAQVAGEIRKSEFASEVGSSFLRPYLLGTMILVFASLFLFFLGRGRLQYVVESGAKTPGFSGLIGLGAFLVIPFVGGVLMVSVVGSLLGLLLFTLYGGLILFSFIATGAMVGYHIQKMLTKNTSITLGTVFFGTMLFSAFGLIPYIGGLLIFAAFLVMFGGTSTLVYRFLRS